MNAPKNIKKQHKLPRMLQIAKHLLQICASLAEKILFYLCQ